jgi:nickel/cobalt transporter (NicO) family protein
MRNAAIHILPAILACAALPLGLGAHPMGNFSINHYARLDFGPHGAELTYVLDLAEIPAFQLLGQWQIDWKDQNRLTEKSRQQADEWLENIVLTQAGRRVPLHVASVSPSAVEGAGGMPILRISIATGAALEPGEVAYEDRNFPGRAGWKEIVVAHDPAVALRSSQDLSRDLSKALTYYPTDPSITPPQDLSAQVDWSRLPAAEPITSKSTPPVPVQTASTAAPEPLPVSFSQQQPDAPGSVVRGDFLSRMLQRKQLTGSIVLLGILVAFGLGSLHAMSPGHGKTIVAAYLVGSRGTLKHAGLLGFVVTFTHTFTVFLLGLGVLFFQRYVVPEKIVPALGAISGLSIVSIGLMLLYRRAKALMEGGSGHAHSHSHSHDAAQRPGRSRIAELREAEASHVHYHDHDHEHDHPHLHGDGLVHTHGGSTHSHAIEGEITPGSLIALGISGGMVPCPSALILMLSAIALGHPGVGLVLLIGFSTGLALVLMAFGTLAIYAKHLLPSSESAVDKPLFRLIPVFSAVVVICLGLAMTAVSAGWIQPMRFLS